MSNQDKVKTPASAILEDALGEVTIPTMPPMSLADELLENKNSLEGEGSNEIDNDSITDFCERFLKSSGSGDSRRSNTAISIDIMDTLKSVIFYLDPKCALSNYIENILLAHLEQHKDLINSAVAKKIKPIVI